MKRLLSSPLLVLLVMPVACKPVGAVLLNDGDAFTKRLEVDVRVEGQGVDSTLRTMALSNDGVTFAAEQPFGPLARGWKLDEKDGLKTVYVKVTDEAGEEKVWEDQIILDRTAPALTVKLNGGAASTTQRAVEVQLFVEDELSGLESLALSNDGSTFTAIDLDAREASWTLSDGAGEKTVFARAIDGAGNPVKASAKIFFGTVAPTFAVKVAGGDGLVNTRTVQVAVTGVTAAEVAELCFSNDPASFPAASCGTSLSRSHELSAGDGDKTVFARLTTPSGGRKTASDTLTLDATPPSASLNVNGGAASTNSNGVSLQFTATDALSGVAEVQAKNEGGAYQTLTSSPADFTLTSGAGTKRVFLKVKDAAGNVREVSDDILVNGGEIALAAKGMCATRLGAWDDANVDAEMAAMAKAGVQIYRYALDWSVIGREQGKFFWGGSDKVFKAAAKHGIQLMALVTYTPAWARGGGSTQFHPPTDIGANGSPNWNAFIAAAARRYAPNGTERDPSWVGTPAQNFGVTHWEVWNEMNCNFGDAGGFWKPAPDPANYGRLLKGTYLTLKGSPGTGAGAIDSGRYRSHTVIMGGMSNAREDKPETQMQPDEFLEGVYAVANNHFDAVGYHPYWWATPTPEYSMVPTAQRIYAVMQRHGDGHMKIWATEQGTPTTSLNILGNSPSKTDEQQADRLAKHWAAWRALPFAGPAFEFNLRETGTNPSNNDDAFGLLRFNRLDVDEANFERNLGGWTALANVMTGYPQQEAGRAHEGQKSLELKAAAAGAASVKSVGGTNGEPVRAGTRYLASALVQGAAQGRPATVAIRFFNGTGGVLSTVKSDAVTTSTGTWKELEVTAAAPTGAAFAQVIVEVQSLAAAESHFVDRVVFRPEVMEAGVAEFKRGTGTKSAYEIYRDLPPGRIP